MDITTPEDLLECIESIVNYLSPRDDTFYVALELAQQLQDEIIQAIPDDE